MDKIRISHSRRRLSLPHTIFCCVISSQNFHHRNIFGAELTNLSIHYRYWIFFVGQILTKLNCLRLRYAKDLRYTFSSSARGKTGWTRDNSGVNTNLFATSPTVDQISNGPMYLGASFSFLPYLITSFIGDTFRNTKSPAENDTSFLLGFA